MRRRADIIAQWNDLVAEGLDPLEASQVTFISTILADATADAPPKPPASKAPPAAPEGPYEPAPYQAEDDETVKCPNCEKMNDLDASFCDQCGFKLAGAAGVEVEAPVVDDDESPPPAPAPPSLSVTPGGDVPNEVSCLADAGDGSPCSHLASAHANTDTGKNTGACGMVNCECKGMKVADDAPVSAAGEPEVLPEVNADGPAFKIPVAIIEGLATSDGRIIVRGALTARPLPLPLMWLSTSSHGFDSMADAAELAGRIETLEREGDNWVASGHLLNTDVGQALADTLAQMGTMGVSADLADVSSEITVPPSEEDLDFSGPLDGIVDVDTMEQVTAGEIMGLTVCPFPAFAGCYITLDNGVPVPAIPIAEPTLAEAGYALHIVVNEDCAPCRGDTLVASSSVSRPPRAWFEMPEPDHHQPLVVTDDGQVYGHIAEWGVCHIGRPGCVTAPRSRSGYAHFHTGYLRTAEGDDLPVGRLTATGGHANNWAGAAAAQAHYADTAAWAASLRAIDGVFGVWACGALRPGVTEEQVATLRACPPSGDWRPIAGQNELIAVCSVPHPGFPQPRASYKNGQLVSLVAAGVVTHERAPLSTERRLELLEGAMLPTLRDALSSRFRRARERIAG